MSKNNGRSKDFGISTKLTLSFITLGEKFGFPAAIFVMIYIFIVLYATPAQKQEIIDVYILGKGLSQYGVTIFFGVIFVILITVQHYVWKRRLKVVEDELTWLKAWKEGHDNKKNFKD